MHDAELGCASVAQLLHEAKITVIKSENLASSLSTPEGTRLLSERWSYANQLKSIVNTLLLDGSEEFEQKQTSFANLDSVMEAFLSIVSGASDIPITKLLGHSAKGLNATGEGDARNYYDMLDGLRESSLRPALERLDDLLWRDETGAPAPADTFFSWNPLWQMTAKELAELAKIKSETTKNYVGLGLFDDELWGEIIPNQLIEDEVYPGLEAAVAELQTVLAPEEIRHPEPEPAAGGAAAGKPNGRS